MRTKPSVIYKAKTKLFLSTVSKDATRRTICGLIHHNKDFKAKTATTGTCLMLDYSEYCSQLGKLNKSLDIVTHQLSNFEYPRINEIVPDKNKATKVLRIQFDEDAFVKHGKIPSVRIYEDGSYSFKEVEGKTHIVALQQAYLKELKGIPLTMYFYEEFKGVLFTFDEEYRHLMDYIVMPVRV